MEKFHTIRVDVSESIWTVTICRPERRNAVNKSTALELAKAFEAFDTDPEAKVAVLYGEDTFCAGADLKALTDNEGEANHVSETGYGPMGPSRMMLSKPVIAAIEGYAVAGGLELAVWCDLRVMAEDAVMGVFCRRFGVPLIDGGTIRLPRLIGMSHAMDLILTGREVGAEEAKAISLVNRITEKGKALETAQTLARDIAAFPQNCMRSDRQSAYEQWNLNLEDALVNETRLGIKVIESGETLEGASRFSKGEGKHGKF